MNKNETYLDSRWARWSSWSSDAHLTGRTNQGSSSGTTWWFRFTPNAAPFQREDLLMTLDCSESQKNHRRPTQSFWEFGHSQNCSHFFWNCCWLTTANSKEISHPLFWHIQVFEHCANWKNSYNFFFIANKDILAVDFHLKDIEERNLGQNF